MLCVSIRVVLTLVLDHHAVHFGLLGILSNKNAFEVFRISTFRQGFFDLLDECFFFRLANNCKAFLCIEKHPQVVRANSLFSVLVI